MLDVSEVVVAVVATAFPPFVGWAVHRLSVEGRLASRIVRLGAVHAAVPESPEKEEFARHLTAELAKLNVRLRHASVVLHRWKWAVGSILYVVAVVALIGWGSQLSLETNAIMALCAGFAIGAAVIATEAAVVRWFARRTALAEADAPAT